MMLKHRSNVQGNEENSNRKPVFNKSVSIKRLSESVNIATVKRLLLKSETNTETETNFRILLIYFFFGIKNVRVGQSIGYIHFFFFGLKVSKFLLRLIKCTCIMRVPMVNALHSLQFYYWILIKSVLQPCMVRPPLKICSFPTPDPPFHLWVGR